MRILNGLYGVIYTHNLYYPDLYTSAGHDVYNASSFFQSKKLFQKSRKLVKMSACSDAIYKNDMHTEMSA